MLAKLVYTTILLKFLLIIVAIFIGAYIGAVLTSLAKTGLVKVLNVIFTTIWNWALTIGWYSGLYALPIIFVIEVIIWAL